MKKLFHVQQCYENKNEKMQISIINKSFMNGDEFKILEEKLNQYIGNLENYEDLYRIILLIRKVFSDLEEYQLRIHMESEDISYFVEYKEHKLRFFSYNYKKDENECTTTYSHCSILNTTFSVKTIAKGYMLDDLIGNCIRILWQEIKKIYFLNRLSAINLEDVSLEQLLMEESISVRKRSL